MTGCSLRRLQERAVPAGSHSPYGTRRTARDEGVGTREQPVRAPIQHSGAMTGCSLRRLQEPGSVQLADGLHGLQRMQTARNLRARRFRRRA
jgi:hypothetical protein